MKFLPTFFFLCFVFNGFSQSKSIEVKLLSTMKVNADVYVGSDAFGNHYTIKDHVFQKETFASEYSYKNIALGKIESVDLQNPLQIVLFYKQMNAVILLDNQLNETIKINFSENNPELFPVFVRLASQNRLWLYDQNSQKLGLYDYVKNHFHPITVNLEFPMTQCQSDYNYFYWTNNQKQLLASNIYGKINNLGSLPDFDQFEIITANEILLKKGTILSLYNLTTKTLQIIPLPEKSIQSFCYKEQILAIFTDNEIRNYKIILP